MAWFSAGGIAMLYAASFFFPVETSTGHFRRQGEPEVRVVHAGEFLLPKELFIARNWSRPEQWLIASLFFSLGWGPNVALGTSLVFLVREAGEAASLSGLVGLILIMALEVFIHLGHNGITQEQRQLGYFLWFSCFVFVVIAGQIVKKRAVLE